MSSLPIRLSSSTRFAQHAVRSTRVQTRQLSITERNMASSSAQSEGPSKGSGEARLQSQADKTENFEQASQEIGRKMQTNPEAVTAEDAAHLKSREARVIGQGQPSSDSISADAQRLASANVKAAGGISNESLSASEQSAVDRVQNFNAVGGHVAEKMANDPKHVTKEEANLIHSREQRAFGSTSKGGIASQARSLSNENEKLGTA